MSVVLVIINIIQLALLPTYHNYYWSILCPGLVFLGFVFCAFALAVNNKKLVKRWWSGDESQPSQRGAVEHPLLNHGASTSEGQRYHEEADGLRPRQRATHISVVATIILDLVLCQFLYVPLSARGDATTVVWSSSVNANQAGLPFPTIVIYQYISRRPVQADLDASYSDAAQCTEDNGLCPTNWYHNQTNRGPLKISWYDGVDISSRIIKNNTAQTYPQIQFAYSWNSTASEVPRLGVSAIDPIWTITDFVRAFNSGITEQHLFPVRQPVVTSFEQTNIADEIQALPCPDSTGLMSKSCRSFRKYSTYSLSISPLGVSEGTTCDVATEGEGAQTCEQEMFVGFSSTWVTTSTSGRKKGLVDMLTEEGGIVGGVTFFTWFLTIFNL